MDIAPQPRYPFEFVQADALEFLADHGHEFDAIHASPPCQGYSIMHNLPWLRGRDYPLLILPTIEMLGGLGKPYVVENVMGARHGSKTLKKRGLEAHGLKAGWLCGTMFGLPFYRHMRLFGQTVLWSWRRAASEATTARALTTSHGKDQSAVAALPVRVRPGRRFGVPGRARVDEFDAIHASLPCQGYSIMHNLPWLRGRDYPLLILPTIEMRRALASRTCVENVMGARHSATLRKRGLEAHGLKAGWLCGHVRAATFYRHRLFATNWMKAGATQAIRNLHQKVHRAALQPGSRLGQG